MRSRESPDRIREELALQRQMREEGKITLVQFRIRTARLLKRLERSDQSQQQRTALT